MLLLQVVPAAQLGHRLVKKQCDCNNTMSVIISFKDAGTEDIFNGKKTKKARKTCPEKLWKLAIRKLELT